jgi:hypothetical protein
MRNSSQTLPPKMAAMVGVLFREVDRTGDIRSNQPSGFASTSTIGKSRTAEASE